MEHAIGIILLALSATVFFRYLARYGGTAEYPFWVSLLYLGWLCPQYFALTLDQSLPDGALFQVGLIAILSLLGILVGWNVGSSPSSESRSFNLGPSLREAPSTRRQMLTATSALTVLGLIMQVLLRTMDPGDLANSQWTGPITIVAFFSQSTTAAFAMSLLIYFASRNRKAMMLGAINLLVITPSIVIYFRRGTAANVLLALMLSLWFTRRWMPGRWLTTTVVALGILAVNSIGALRPYQYVDTAGKLVIEQRSWKQIGEIDFLGAIFDPQQNAASELRNAAYFVSAVSVQLTFNFGSDIWNGLVSSYVPAQWVGRETKQSLMIGDSLRDSTWNVYQYTGTFGSTATGLSDSFGMFWYFGIIWFGIIGYWMRRMYSFALQGSMPFQALYIISMVSALHCITHYSTHLVQSFPSYLLFLVGALKWATLGRASANLKTLFWGHAALPMSRGPAKRHNL
jgi:hypothetical protein